MYLQVLETQQKAIDEQEKVINFLLAKLRHTNTKEALDINIVEKEAMSKVPKLECIVEEHSVLTLPIIEEDEEYKEGNESPNFEDITRQKQSFQRVLSHQRRETKSNETRRCY